MGIIENDEQLEKINKELLILRFNPTNLKVELKKVIDDASYNPQFEYNYKNKNYERFKTQLHMMNFSSEHIDQILKKKRDELLLKCDLLASIGKPEFSRLSEAFWGKPGAILLWKARNILRKPKPVLPKTEKLNPNEILALVGSLLQKNGFDWKVVEKQMIAVATVRPQNKTVYVKKGESLSKEFVKRIINHELVHVIRYENGSRQPFKIFRYGFSDYLATEEGLAIRYEEDSPYFSKRIRDCAGRVVAAQLAQKYDFSRMYRYFCRHYSARKAFFICARAKRGLSDTSVPGGNTKDHLYLKGYYEVKKFERNHDIKELFIGKIGIQDNPIVKKLPGIEKPTMFPDS